MDSPQRASGTVVDPRASLAMWLRTGRTQRNLSLEDVARVTKIQARILEKLENGILEGLPADVFLKGFVRSFAKCVGLDEGEAIERFGAARSGNATTVAKAFVDSMSVRLVQPPALMAQPASSSTSIPMASASSPEIQVVEVFELAPVVVVETAPVVVVETAEAAGEQPKKKRAPRKKNPSAAPRSRKKKSDVDVVAAPVVETTETAAGASAEIAASESAEIAAVAETAASTESAERTDAQIPATVRTDVFSQDGMLAATDERISAREIAIVHAMSPEDVVEISGDDAVVEPQEFAEGSQPNSSRIEVIDMAAGESPESWDHSDASGSWQPTMPTLSTSPSVPWRRPQIPQQATYVVPHLVIDDADPDSADRQREREERANREHSRLSFLPAILLDREDRSARQGGLTLAVIILLIAATLTLSYLMRRPSARGDGVTLLDGSSELLG